jgi:hypothetical protein
MFRTVVVVASVLVCCGMTRTQSFSQASKQLEERAKKVATPQQESWKQVDEINKETDKTKGRYNQAQQSGSQPSQKSGYVVKKKGPGVRGAYKKPSTAKQKPAPKRK